MGEEIKYSPKSLLLNSEAGGKSTPERVRLGDILAQNIARFVRKELDNWKPPLKAVDKDIIGEAGVKTPVGRKMQIGGAFRGQQVNPERTFTEQKLVEDKKHIPVLQLHLIIEASPPIIGIRHLQGQALDTLKVFSGMDVSQINSLLESGMADTVDKRVQLVVITKNGISSWELGKTITPSDLEREYQNALLASLTAAPNSNPELIGFSANGRIEDLLSGIKGDRNAGVMSVPILAGQNITKVPFKDKIYVTFGNEAPTPFIKE